MGAMKRALWVGLCAAAVLSCSDATGPVATVSATVTRVTTGAPGSLDAFLDVELTNTSSVGIQLAPCALSLERQNAAGEWEQVWSLACLASASTDNLIPAGSSKTLTVRITAQGNGQSWPSAGLDGTYRLRFYVFPPDGLIKRMATVTNMISATPVVSNEFTLQVF
jgi:hypothetical protein